MQKGIGITSSEYRIMRYSAEYEERWDHFIEEESCNGTFLQSRLFLNYHGNDKFIDCSLMFFDDEILVAVCPACIREDAGEKSFVSHAGSTYGGIIISKKLLRAYKILDLLDCFEMWLVNNGFNQCVLKQTNSLMCKQEMDLLDFGFYYNKYTEYKELNLYVDYEKLNTNDIVSNFTKLKKRTTKKCISEGMNLIELFEREELIRFLEILSLNLQKYNMTPYHTVDELLDLKKRFPLEIQFWGCVYHEKIVAIAMTFYFKRSKCVHTHYLAADPEYDKQSPMTFVYYKLMYIFNNQDCRFLSWGITTEHMGVELNYNLTNSKEGFGSSHNIVSVYKKELRN